MRFQILTLFPDAFRALAEYSILGRAARQGRISISSGKFALRIGICYHNLAVPTVQQRKPRPQSEEL